MSKAPKGRPHLPVRTSTPPTRSSTRTRTTRDAPARPVVWLRRHRVYALPTLHRMQGGAARRQDLHLRRRASALNPLTNRLSRGTTLTATGRARAAPQARRAPTTAPCPTRHRRPKSSGRPAASSTPHCASAEIDGVEDLACALPMAVVPDLVGWPQRPARQLAALGRSDIRHPRPAQRASAEVVHGQPCGCCASPVGSSVNAASSRAASAMKSCSPPTTARCPHAELARR